MRRWRRSCGDQSGIPDARQARPIAVRSWSPLSGRAGRPGRDPRAARSTARSRRPALGQLDPERLLRLRRRGAQPDPAQRLVVVAHGQRVDRADPRTRPVQPEQRQTEPLGQELVRRRRHGRARRRQLVAILARQTHPLVPRRVRVATVLVEHRGRVLHGLPDRLAGATLATARRPSRRRARRRSRRPASHRGSASRGSTRPGAACECSPRRRGGCRAMRRRQPGRSVRSHGRRGDEPQVRDPTGGELLLDEPGTHRREPLLRERPGEPGTLLAPTWPVLDPVAGLRPSSGGCGSTRTPSAVSCVRP